MSSKKIFIRHFETSVGSFLMGAKDGNLWEWVSWALNITICKVPGEEDYGTHSGKCVSLTIELHTFHSGSISFLRCQEEQRQTNMQIGTKT